MTAPTNQGGRTSLSRILGYALGEGAMSITMNGISNFAMLYYTQVLGLSAAYAGIALGVTMFWDAITDPVMGHITDNTRSRFGRRMPYILLGGIALAITFFLMWIVPTWFQGPVAVFWCVLALNMLVRTSVAVFSIPYIALGFEICPNYEDRSRLQGIRSAFNQVTNLVFGAMAWSVLFRDRTGPDGARIDGTLVLHNYLVMGAVLAGASLLFVVVSAGATWPYANDNRGAGTQGNTPAAFWKDFSAILRDRLSWYVFGFFAVAQFAMLLTSQIQMFTYVFYVKLAATEKTMVHGGGMLAFVFGSLLLGVLTRRFDKKITGYIGMGVCIFGGVLLYAVFMGGGLSPESMLVAGGLSLPLGKVVFGVGQALWWGGCGILVPLAMSMVADLSEINYKQSGVLKDGSYSAVFLFFIKTCLAAGLLLTGYLVEAAGIASGADSQTPEAAHNIAAMTFLVGPILVVVAFFILRAYPVDRHFMARIAAAKPGEGEQSSIHHI